MEAFVRFRFASVAITTVYIPAYCMNMTSLLIPRVILYIKKIYPTTLFFKSPLIKKNIVAALCILVGIYEYPICTLDYGMDPDPDPDPTLFGTCFQDGNKNWFFSINSFCLFLTVRLPLQPATPPH